MPMDTMMKNVKTGDTPDNEMGQKMGGEGEQTTVSLQNYPELRNVKQGQTVKGSWEGQVASIDDKVAVIKYTSLQIETDNSADRELARMSGQKPKETSYGSSDEDEEI